MTANMTETNDVKGTSPSLEPEATPHPAAEKPGDVIDLDEAYSPEEEKAVLRKIDLTILPMVQYRNSILRNLTRSLIL